MNVPQLQRPSITSIMKVDRQLLRKSIETKIGTSQFHILLLSVLTGALLIPFLNKAFNIDDPLFIWVAKQIYLHPHDPYGFKLNWYSANMWAWEVIQNPPVVSYYISFTARFLNWSEKALHIIFIMSSLGVVLGTYYLARRVCSKPLLAGSLVLTMPVFLVSSTSVMCDITMLAFFVWAIVLWTRGLDRNELLSFLASSFLIGLCALTKYYGIILIPILALYTLFKKRTAGFGTMMYLLIPILLLFWYHFKTIQLYGSSLLYNAASYAHLNSGNCGFKILEKYLVGLSFMGGCLITILCISRFLLRREELAASFIIFALTLCSILYIKKTGLYSFDTFLNLGLLQTLQFFIFIFAGILVLLLSTKVVWNNRYDHFLLLLYIWLISTFIFATFLNWTINGRSLLPLVPPFCIITARQVEVFPSLNKIKAKLLLSILCGMFFSFVVASADCRFADTARDAAEAICRKYNTNINRVFFRGHWGFQYYMEQKGFKAIDINNTILAEGDVVIIPQNNTNTFSLPSQIFSMCDKMEFVSFPWIATMHSGSGAGFYSAIWGPLPFAIGAIPPESYYFYRLTKPGAVLSDSFYREINKITRL